MFFCRLLIASEFPAAEKSPKKAFFKKGDFEKDLLPTKMKVSNVLRYPVSYVKKTSFLIFCEFFVSSTYLVDKTKESATFITPLNIT